MELLFIQLAQSVTGAVVTIVLLLLVAAIIGYFTAWFYAKSVYVPKIKALEADKASLEKQVDPVLLRQMVAKANAIEQTFNAFRAKVDGRELTDSEVRQILKESKESQDI